MTRMEQDETRERTFLVFTKKGFTYETKEFELKGNLVVFTDKYDKKQVIHQDLIENIKEITNENR